MSRRVGRGAPEAQAGMWELTRVAVVALAAVATGLGSTLVWVIVGFVLAAATLMITIVVGVPLNNALDTAGAAGRTPDPAQARTAFQTVWVRWNTVRVLASTGSLVALLGALVTIGRGAV